MSDDPVDEFGRQLFAAARADQPPPALRERLARRAPPSRAAELLSVPPPASQLERQRRPARWLLPAALAAVALAAGLVLLERATPEAPPSISAERRAPDVAPRVPGAEPAADEPARNGAGAAPAPVEPLEPAPRSRRSPESEKAPRPTADPHGAATTGAPAPAVPSSNTLIEELDWLKRTRTLLRGGNGAGALELLRDFESKYPGSDLKDEATLLQIESLAAAGRQAEAAALAERFVQSAPTSPLVDRARSFLPPTRGLEPPGKERTP